MMIFSLGAVPVVIVIWVIAHFAERWFPQLAGQPIISWTTGISAIVVGGIADLVGLKARLFFLPIWLIGLGIVCLQMGWPGTVLLIVIAAAGVAWLFRWGNKKEREDWEKAQLELNESTAPAPGVSEREFWEWVKARLFLPISMKFTPQLCDHNLCVLRVIKTTGPRLTPAEEGKIELLEEFLVNVRSAANPVEGDLKRQTDVTEVVDKRLGKADARKPAVPPRIG